MIREMGSRRGPFFYAWLHFGLTRPCALCNDNRKMRIPSVRETSFRKTGFGVRWEYTFSKHSGYIYMLEKYIYRYSIFVTK